VIVAIIKHGLGGGKKHYSICVPNMAKKYKWGGASTIMCRAGSGESVSTID